MSDPITTGSVLLWFTSAIVQGIIGNRSDDTFKTYLNGVFERLKQHRPDENHELQAAIYKAWLQATLQCCAKSYEKIGEDPNTCIVSAIMPNTIKKLWSQLTKPYSLLNIQNQIERDWLDALKDDITELLKHGAVPLMSDQDMASVLADLEQLVQPGGSEDLQKRLLTNVHEVLTVYMKDHGPMPEFFKEIVDQYWFQLFSACFQYSIKSDQKIANIFFGLLISETIVEQEEISNRLIEFGGTLSDILEYAVDTNIRVQALQRESRLEFKEVKDLIGDISLSQDIVVQLHKLSFRGPDGMSNTQLSADSAIDDLKNEYDDSAALHFIALLINHLKNKGENTEALERWLNRHATYEIDNSIKRTYLLIQLQKDAHDASRCVVTPWLWKNSAEWLKDGLTGSTVPFNDLSEAIFTNVREAGKIAGTADLTVDLICPREIFNLDLTEWKDKKRFRFLAKYQSVFRWDVRFVEGLAGEIDPDWIDLTDKIKNSTSDFGGSYVWLHDGKFKSREELVNQYTTAGFGLCFGFDIDPTRQCNEDYDLVGGVLDAGTPIALWQINKSDGACFDEKMFYEIVKKRHLTELPETIRQIRRESYSADDPLHYGRNLMLMYDDCERLPPPYQLAAPFEVPQNELTGPTS